MCFVGGRASGEDGPVGSRSDDNRVFTFYFVCVLEMSVISHCFNTSAVPNLRYYSTLQTTPQAFTRTIKSLILSHAFFPEGLLFIMG